MENVLQTLVCTAFICTMFVETCSASLSAMLPACQTDSDCDMALGQSCHWLYDGCNNGQCMCSPGKHRRHPNGRCIPLRYGNEQCSIDDVCMDGMTCESDVCRCRAGVMTSDKQHCLHKHHKLLGETCKQSSDVCFQKAVYGYTSNEAQCSSDGVCQCADGAKAEGITCRNWRLHERGCSKFFHCEGGAICSEKRCMCPSEYISAASNTKCIRRGAVRDLPVGAQCDEINESLYCAHGLVCHRCSQTTGYRCVRFLLAGDAAFYSNAHSDTKRSPLTVLVTTLASVLFTSTSAYTSTLATTFILHILWHVPLINILCR